MISSVDRVLVLVYLSGMIGVGIYLFRRTRSFDQFLLAGRRLPPALLICTLVSTYYGLGVLLAGSEISYEAGVVNWFFDTAPAYIAILLTAIFLAPRIRGHVIRSIPDLVDVHYGLTARVLAALASFIYSLPAFSILGLGGLLTMLFDVPFRVALILGSLVALAYTALGGLMAVAITDAIQFLLMALTLAAAAAIGLWEIGGVSALEHQLPDHFIPTGGRSWQTLVVYSMTALSVLIEPALYQRILAATSRRAVAIAMGAGLVLWMSYDWVVTILGISAHAAVGQGLMPAPASPDQAVTTFVLFILPPVARGLFAAGLAAAAMSTLDSYLLISSSNLVYDIWKPLFQRKMSDRSLLKWTRLMLIGSTAANIVLCLLFPSVERLWIFITAILVCTSLVPVLAALFMKQVRRPAGAVSTAVGFCGVLIYYGWVALAGSWSEAEAAYIWEGDAFGLHLILNQDHGMLYLLPLSFVSFLLVQFWPVGRRP